MFAIYKREMRAFFTSIIGYAYLFTYFLIGGAVFCYTTLYAMTADVSTFFQYMLIFSAVTLPVLTMKSFSEERKTRTEQLLLTAPVSIPAMILGKFFASFTVFGGGVLVSSLYFILLSRHAVIKVLLLLGNILALLLVGMAFIAVGLFVSSLTENQLASAVGTFGIIFAFLAIGVLNNLLPSEYWLRYVFDCLSVFSRYSLFMSGVFDISSVLYYLSVSAVFLYLTYRVYDRRRCQ